MVESKFLLEVGVVNSYMSVFYVIMELYLKYLIVKSVFCSCVESEFFLIMELGDVFRLLRVLKIIMLLNDILCFLIFSLCFFFGFRCFEI